MTEEDVIEASQLGVHDTTGGELPDSLRIDDWEAKLIREALKHTEGKVPEAAKLLGIGRATLYRKLDEYGIQR
jgi:transcriptional regulator of acetoin/glycerol metabolism